jgi:hypothetical protein
MDYRKMPTPGQFSGVPVVEFGTRYGVGGRFRGGQKFDSRARRFLTKVRPGNRKEEADAKK